MSTKKELVLSALQSTDRGITAAQMEARFGVANPTALVSELRFDGYAIYANRHTDTKGRVKTFYRLGTPARSVVAAGYRALAAGLI